MTRVALIGFGEVGQTLAEDLLALGAVSVAVWDIQFPDADSGPSLALSRLTAVEACKSAASAVRGADFILCAVTAERTAEAALSVAGHSEQGAWYVDLNSASPETKKLAAACLNERGVRYVEASVMSPIGPKRMQSPILVSGDHARAFAAVASDVGLTGVSFFSDEYGQASAAKMCRSVIVKGVEALVTESLTAAHHYGVEETVVKSLTDLFPGLDWPNLATYMMSRALIHGKRRAEEMREVAKTVADAGLEPLLSDAIARRQDWSAALDIDPAGMTLAALLETISDKKAGAS
jgi:3-hydroxyisobutyrate dehydrogenase-like beta-hydroxyacid dehydrogenase